MPPKAKNGYKLPAPLPLNLVVEDVNRNKWKLGPSIGKGGFGEIYSAKDASSSGSSFPYVVKIEPHKNGPLFVEMHFYMRNGKEDQIQEFKVKKKLASLGMPKYIASGSHEHNGEKYRFVVMEKFGSDIWKIFLENDRRFSPDIVFKLGVQILDVLEYIHSQGYIHADIKGPNILLGPDAESDSQVYLVDFGLCSHYSASEKPDPKKAHNGTIEYVSRDGHLGIESRRGDLECLGYNLVQWLGCALPWEVDLSDPKIVQQSKIDNMKNLTTFFKKCFSDGKPPGAISEYMKYVSTLKFGIDPDYGKLRKILVKGVEAAGGSMKAPFGFKTSKSSPAKRKIAAKSPTPKKKTKVVAKKTKATKTAKPVAENREKDVEEDNEVNVENGQEAEDNMVGYTDEMKNIKKKLDEKKKKAVKPVSVAEPRPLRVRKEINYSDNSPKDNPKRTATTKKRS